MMSFCFSGYELCDVWLQDHHQQPVSHRQTAPGKGTFFPDISHKPWHCNLPTSSKLKGRYPSLPCHPASTRVRLCDCLQQMSFMRTSHQFLLLSSPPAKEAIFREARQKHGSTFAFQSVHYFYFSLNPVHFISNCVFYQKYFDLLVWESGIFFFLSWLQVMPKSGFKLHHFSTR